MPVRNGRLSDAIKFLGSLTLAAVASTVVLLVGALLETVASSPSPRVWGEFPLAFVAVVYVAVWVFGSLPAAYAFYARLGILGCTVFGFGYGFLVALLLNGVDHSNVWKTSLLCGISGMAGGVAFALVVRVLDRG